MTARASAIVCSGRQVTGSTIMPDSERFNLSTSAACASIVRFLCTTPMPPCCAMAMARRDSVTVSIAAERIGMFSEIPAVNRVVRLTSRGWTFDLAGRSRTSSNVRARGNSERRDRESFRAAIPDISLIRALPRERSAGAGSARRAQIPRSARSDGSCARRRRPVAFLVFSSGAARTRVIASDLRGVPVEGLHLGVLASRSRGAVGVVDVAGAARGHGRGGATGAGFRHLAFRLAHHGLEAEEVLYELILDAFLHQREELEGFLLIFDERVALAIAAQADAFLQVIERQQMVLPLLVHDLQHHELLVEPHGLRAAQLFLCLVPAGQLREQVFPDLLPGLAAEGDGLILQAVVLLQIDLESGE